MSSKLFFEVFQMCFECILILLNLLPARRTMLFATRLAKEQRAPFVMRDFGAAKYYGQRKEYFISV